MQNYDVANRIYELRKEKGLSQKELGALIGVSNKAVSKWETGAAVPKTETIIKLASALGITAEELLCGKRTEAENLNTLGALSDKTANIFLQSKLNDYETDKKSNEYKNAKIYFISVICMFIAVTIIFIVLYIMGNNIYPLFLIETENSLSLKEVILSSVVMSYIFCSVYTGISVFISFIKKIPVWVTAVLLVIFPITFLFIEITGMIMVIPEIIMSVKAIIKKGKNKNG